MSIADELRRDADAALKEYGMFYSGEYLRGIAKRVEEVEAENAKLRKFAKIDTEDIDTMSCLVDDLRAENDRLRDEIVRYVDLASILDREWNINVDWDGVRRIWYVGLTELGVRLRDEREAVRMAQVETINELEDMNAKLRDLCEDMYRECAESMGYDHPLIRDLGIEASV